MGADKDRVLNLCSDVEVTPDGLDDKGFDLMSRDPANRTGLLGTALQQRRRQVVPVLDAPFADMARAHAVVAVIEDAAR